MDIGSRINIIEEGIGKLIYNFNLLSSTFFSIFNNVNIPDKNFNVENFNNLKSDFLNNNSEFSVNKLKDNVFDYNSNKNYCNCHSFNNFKNQNYLNVNIQLNSSNNQTLHSNIVNNNDLPKQNFVNNVPSKSINNSVSAKLDVSNKISTKVSNKLIETSSESVSRNVEVNVNKPIETVPAFKHNGDTRFFRRLLSNNERKILFGALPHLNKLNKMSENNFKKYGLITDILRKNFQFIKTSLKVKNTVNFFLDLIVFI